jgi:hypothetical protein
MARRTKKSNPSKRSPTKTKKPIWPWVVGGVAVVGAATAVGVVLYRRNRAALPPGTTGTTSDASSAPATATESVIEQVGGQEGPKATPPAAPTPTAPPAPNEIITAPPPGSPPDAAPVLRTESVVAPAPEPPAVAPPVAAPGSPPPTPTTPPPVPHTVQHQTLLQRLRGGDAARQIFGFQSALYSTGFTGVVPDGLLGPTTAGLIRSVTAMAGSPVSGVFRGRQTFSDLASANAHRFATGAAGYQLVHSPRLIPMALPADVIRLVNASTTRVGGPVIQVAVLTG